MKARKKGSNYELQVIKLFKELGWSKCVSSRSESKRTDDSGVDVCFSKPFQIQCKSWERAPSYHEVLSNMPKVKGLYNLIFHKRNYKGSVVVLSEADFIEILTLLIDSGAIKPEC